MDTALISYTAIAGSGDPCERDLERTDWNGAATITASVAGSFGVYGASARMSVCDVTPPGLVLDGIGAQAR